MGDRDRGKRGREEFGSGRRDDRGGRRDDRGDHGKREEYVKREGGGGGGRGRDEGGRRDDYGGGRRDERSGGRDDRDRQSGGRREDNRGDDRESRGGYGGGGDRGGRDYGGGGGERGRGGRGYGGAGDRGRDFRDKRPRDEYTPGPTQPAPYQPTYTQPNPPSQTSYQQQQQYAPREQPSQPSQISLQLSQPSATAIPRPGPMTIGRPIPVLVNHVPFTFRVGTIYQADVEFKPDVQVKRVRRACLEQHVDRLKSIVFDGRLLFLLESVGPTGVLELESKDPKSGEKIMVTIVERKVLKADEEKPAQLYNLLLKSMLRALNLKLIGRQFFDPKKAAQIPQHHVELWPGYFSSINLEQIGTCMTVDLAHKILRTDSVIQYIDEKMERSRDGRADVSKALIGQVVITRYNNRTYRIDDVCWDLSPISEFDQKSTGRKVSFKDYFQKAYNLKITRPDQPLLLHKRKLRGGGAEQIYLVPELCSMTGLSEEMRSDYNVMRDIAEHTRISPGKRAEGIAKFVRSLAEDPTIQKELGGWQPTMPASGLTELTAKQLPPESIMFANKEIQPRDGDWSFAIKNSQPLVVVNFTNWVFIGQGKSREINNNILRSLDTIARPLGIQLAKPHVIELRGDTQKDYAMAVRDAAANKPQLILSVLPNNRKDRYKAIKHEALAVEGIPSQCLLEKNARNPQKLMSVLNKLLLQMNCKAGGELWAVNIPMKNAMIVGIDVCHSGPRHQSVVGFCASLNDSYTSYYSRIDFQHSSQEIIDKLSTLMSDALRAYFNKNKKLPDRIIVFRDGVGEGQISAVETHEALQIHEAVSKFPDYKPGLAIIVVSKRIRTRIFARSGPNLENAPPGSVVDYAITPKQHAQFFLVPQSVRQGTVTPVSFTIILNHSGLNPEHLQMLAYKMCHLYPNWPGTIRVPAPVQLAHKCCFLVGECMQEDIAAQLRNSLYYL